MTLLEEILLRIEIYGGRDKLLRDIDREWGFFLGGKNFSPGQRKRGATPVWSSVDSKYLLKWHKRLTVVQLCKRLGRSKKAVLLRIHNIKKTAV